MSTMIENVVTARYDAEHHELRLDQPLEGVRDGEMVRVHVQVPVAENPDPDPSVMEFRGILSGAAGESFARAIDEMFPIEK